MYKYFIYVFMFTLSVNSQNKKYPTNYFSSPLKIPIIFSGTFGELRSNHFHSGIDIKTQGKEGIPIYAPANGYIYRIKTKQYGYGKALYIKHPNGFSTVYAHLQKFSDSIQSYVKSMQYKNKKYFLNQYFKPNKFPVKKGEVIGYTGDTGSSGGPHLHYEIRDSNENIINPMLFGITTEDTIAPHISDLLIFPLNNNSRINNTNTKTKVQVKKIDNGKYKTDKIFASGLIGLGVKTYDQQSLAKNKNGIFSLEMIVNGKRVYYHDMETFSFSESKYLNLLIDYEHYAKHKVKVQKTHKVLNNKLSIYENLIENGTLNIVPKSNYNIEIIVKDFHNNTSTLTIPIEGIVNNEIFTEKDTTAYKISRNNFSKFEKENISVAFPKKTVYQDVFINFEVNKDTAFIHTPTIPLDRKFTLTFDVSHLSIAQKEKTYIAYLNKNKKPSFIGSKTKKSKIYTTTKKLGTYTLLTDKNKPEITLLNIKDKKWITSNKNLKIKIKDNESGIKNYHGRIDNEWILLEYNHKKGILTYDFTDKKLSGSMHKFEIEVIDNVGNSNSKTITFYKKQKNISNKK